MPANERTIQEEINFCIKWEEVRAEYFRTHGDFSKQQECMEKIKELRWKYSVNAA